MSDSLINIIINTVKKGHGDKETISNIKKLNNNFKELTGISLGSMTAIGAVGFALKKMHEYSKIAVSASSDLIETQSKAKVVFGNEAKAVLEFGEQAANALGMSENAALTAAATYGNLFQAMGIGEDISSRMSTKLVTLAGDLASFNNMDPSQVLDKLRAGLSGETEPLKSLGVNLNQATIQQRALELGLWDGVGALNAAQKAQSSYSLIIEQTSLAQGDFKRTSEGLANQQRILKANTEDLAAAVGQYLLPSQTALVESQNLLISQSVDYIHALQDEKDLIQRLGLSYDQHIGYTKDGILLTGEQVNAMKSADRANQAWTASLEAQADAYFDLHPELRHLITEYDGLSDSLDGVEKEVVPLTTFFKDLTTEMIFNAAAAGLEGNTTAILQLASAMGLLNTNTFNVLTAIDSVTKKMLDDYGAWAAWVDLMGDVAAGPGYGGSWSTPSSPVGPNASGTGPTGGTGDWVYMGTQGGPGTASAWWSASKGQWYYGPNPPKGANGLDFVVPPGYPNDSFPILAQSGERVKITPAGRTSGGNVININVSGAGDPNMVANAVMRKLRLQGVA